MRTDLIAYVLASDNRRAVVMALLDRPSRLWGCSAVEDLTGLSHATVFRTLRGLRDFGLLRSSRPNRKDIVYELAHESPLLPGLRGALDATRSAARDLARKFARAVGCSRVQTIILYGSAVAGELHPGSDIDVLVVLPARDDGLAREIKDVAADLSTRANWTLSVQVLTMGELRASGSFLKGVREHMEVLHGKSPF